MFSDLAHQQQCGQDDSLIDRQSLPMAVHQQVVPHFLRLQSQSRQAGFELAIASSYRSFDRQLAIWNAKACGERPVLDDCGRVLDLMELSPWQQVQAILRWSALPGASRHHWGTDLDIYDSAAMEEGYTVQLTAEEVAPDGPFGPLHKWLDKCIDEGRSCGFFRPYAEDTGGVAQERWHISYAPLAIKFQQGLSAKWLAELLTNTPLQLKSVVLEHMDEIFQSYVEVPLTAYPSQYRGYSTGNEHYVGRLVPERYMAPKTKRS